MPNEQISDVDEFDALVKGEAAIVPASSALARPGAERVLVRKTEHLEAWARDDTYPGISEKPVSEDQAKALCDPVTDDEVDIKPDGFGAVYLGHHGYRRRLNKAFRPGGWALRRLTPYTFDKDRQIAYAEFALYGEGRYLGSATGEQRIPENNNEMSHGDIIEGLKSNALMRCCKDLGVAMECWDLKWTNDFRRRLCVKVWVKPNAQGQAKMRWRRLDADPFFGETGLVNDSPNREAYEAKRKSAVEKVKDDQFAGVSEELRASIEKGFEIMGLTPGQRTAKINEFLGNVEPSHRDVAAQKMYDWLKQEYAKKKADASAAKAAPDNGKAARPSASAKSDAPRSEAPSGGLGASDPNAADSDHSSPAAPTAPKPSASSSAGPVGGQKNGALSTPKQDLF